MAWSRVARPVELGGVSVIDLMTMGYALWLCWEWLARTEPQRLWTAMPSKTERVVLAMFEASVTVQIGNGAQTLFWHDRWLNGSSIRCLAPDVVQAGPQLKTRS
jgi:hypothetical protein